MIARTTRPAIYQAIRSGGLGAYQKGRKSRVLISRQQVADWLGMPVEDVRISYSPHGEDVA